MLKVSCRHAKEWKGRSQYRKRRSMDIFKLVFNSTVGEFRRNVSSVYLHIINREISKNNELKQYTDEIQQAFEINRVHKH